MSRKPEEETHDFEKRVAGVAALDEPVRRSLYRYVRAARRPVSRDEAARGTGVPRHVASFHLDRLEAEGLLEAEFRRPPGKGGPGAGRPAKLYRRSSQEVSVSLPERRYALAGRLLAEAITRAGREGVPADAAIAETAFDAGQALGMQGRAVGARAAEPLDALSAMLEEEGYEPYREGDDLFMANCPFHALARDYTDLVCGLNLGLLRGLVAGAGMAGVTARLDPGPNRCCVVFARD